jgi:hypothetical protein
VHDLAKHLWPSIFEWKCGWFSIRITYMHTVKCYDFVDFEHFNLFDCNTLHYVNMEV